MCENVEKRGEINEIKELIGNWKIYMRDKRE